MPRPSQQVRSLGLYLRFSSCMKAPYALVSTSPSPILEKYGLSPPYPQQPKKLQEPCPVREPCSVAVTPLQGCGGWITGMEGDNGE